MDNGMIAQPKMQPYQPPANPTGMASMNQMMSQLGSMAKAAQTPSAPAQAPLQYGAYSLPNANMSDAALQSWYSQNAGRQIYNAGGQITQIPGGMGTGAGQLRYSLTGKNGILNGATLGQNPGTAQLPDYMKVNPAGVVGKTGYGSYGG
jgi:hypothetical protein